MARLLVLDDNRVSAVSLARLLASEGHEVEWYSSSRAALNISSAPDLFICDWILNDGATGVEVARQLLSDWPHMRVIFMTGMPAEKLRREARDLPVEGVFEKPLPLEELLAVIERLEAMEDPDQPA